MRAFQAARQAEQIARRLSDASLLAFALNGVFMRTFHRAGLAARRDAIGAEVVSLSAHHNLVTYEVLGHLIRLQSRCALADFAAADRHAEAANSLAERHDLPLVSVFTTWCRALRASMTQPLCAAESAYEEAAACWTGLQGGLLPLARLSLHVRHHQAGRIAEIDGHADWGPYEPWVRPLLLLSLGDDDGAREALRTSPPRRGICCSRPSGVLSPRRRPVWATAR